MYCPKCRSEFREGFIECSDCHVPLKSGLPPDAPSPNPPPELPTLSPHDLALVAILECQHSIQLALAEGLLKDAGIPYLLGGRLWGLATNSYHPSSLRLSSTLPARVTIQVPQDQEAEARALLAHLTDT